MHRRLVHFSLLVICGVGLTACPTERFRHEKYKCNSGAFGIAEIIVNDTGVGDMAKIIGYGYNSSIKKNDPTAHAEILAIKKATIILKNK